MCNNSIINTTIMYINRKIESIIRSTTPKKAIIVYGARQTGKTTLLKHIFSAEKTLWLSCDEERVRQQIVPDSLVLKGLFGKATTVIFDEAQMLPDAGRVLKIIVDQLPEIQVIATGSSAFDIANKVAEPLTGRHYTYYLYPLAWSELVATIPPTDHLFTLEQTLQFGSYPGVAQHSAREEKIRELELLSDAYLYKDILAFDLIKDSTPLRNLLIALALQIGSEVSYHELSKTLGINYKTVERYIDLLEKIYVVFRLPALARNQRNELKRKVKIYFYDCGIRNALINNFNPLNLRNDAGALFENFVVAEFAKRDSWQTQRANRYFWRTYDGKEIDLITEKNSVLTAYEIKLTTPERPINPTRFLSEYPEASFGVIAKDDIATIRTLLE